MTDDRLTHILDLIKQLSSGNVHARMAPSGEGDVVDEITEGLNQLGRELQYAIVSGKFFRTLAHHDHLTNLPNRFLLEDRVERAVERARRNGNAVVVAYLDLNEFKPINDRYGHAVGDAMLTHVANAMRSAVRATDTVARIGGDEFAILFEDVHLIAEIPPLLERVADAVSTPVEIPASGGELCVSPSIGISLYPEDGETVHALIESADHAMFHAKRTDETFCFASEVNSSSNSETLR